jgi:hypothetical protein
MFVVKCVGYHPTTFYQDDFGYVQAVKGDIPGAFLRIGMSSDEKLIIAGTENAVLALDHMEKY